MDRYSTYGIHTRLKYVIKRANGIDKTIRREYLRNTYNLDDETLDLALMYDVEGMLKTMSVAEMKQFILDYKARKSRKAQDTLVEFGQMLNIVANHCGTSKYFNLMDNLFKDSRFLK